MSTAEREVVACCRHDTLKGGNKVAPGQLGHAGAF